MKIETITIDNREYKILIGQNSNENDKIIRMSEPHDIWFHFENISGPHIVLQCASYKDNEQIPNEILRNIGQKLYEYKKGTSNEKIIYTEIKNLKMTKIKGQVITTEYKILK
jgi:predicted ribosome quality control (RQC) complex YloA/Tae2 family protein